MNTTATHRLHPDLVVLTQAAPVPGRGFLPIASYLLLGKQPVLVDTGAARNRAGFIEALESVLDPKDLAWIVVTHADDDHTGALELLLERAPKARLAMNWITTGKLGGDLRPADAARHLGEPRRGARRRRPRPPRATPPDVRRPVHDDVLRLEEPRALHVRRVRRVRAGDGRDVRCVDEKAVLEGMSVFCRANSPWLADVRPDRYETSLKAYADLEISWLLSGHLPPVAAPSAGRVIARAASFPLEGRVAAPGQQALAAALAHAAAAA